VTREGSSWKAVPIKEVPPTDAGLAVAWDLTGSDWMYLSTENSGAWKGTVSW
jgi:hypothetical protein